MHGSTRASAIGEIPKFKPSIVAYQQQQTPSLLDTLKPNKNYFSLCGSWITT
jgi:hypothetical protein